MVFETIKKDWKAKVGVLIFVALTCWWLVNNYIIGLQHIKTDGFGDFGDIYGVMALWGGIWGLSIAKKWGGLRSVFGRALLMFSFGLIAQEFGQLAYSLDYIITKQFNYPNIGDLGFFGSITFYTLGIIFLAQASGVRINVKSIFNILLAAVIPALILCASYFVFLQGYEFDWQNPIKVFLDFGYPLGQAFYISLALLTYLFSRRVLGGVMKSKVLFLLAAFVLQYAADFNFLYQNSRGTWVNGWYGDYLYLLAYVVMTMGIFQLKTVFDHLES